MPLTGPTGHFPSQTRLNRRQKTTALGGARRRAAAASSARGAGSSPAGGAPSRAGCRTAPICHPGVLVADSGGKEFQNAMHSGVAGADDRQRLVLLAPALATCDWFAVMMPPPHSVRQSWWQAARLDRTPTIYSAAGIRQWIGLGNSPDLMSSLITVRRRPTYCGNSRSRYIRFRRLDSDTFILRKSTTQFVGFGVNR
jgi:hypothetical protein